MKRVFAAAVLTLALGLWAAPAWAQTYRWVDDQGRVHYGQGLDSVPERYRAGARVLSFPPPSPEPQAAPGEGAGKAGGKAAGKAEIRFRPGEPIWVDARINNAGTVRLMLDTGAQVTTINPRALEQLGVSSRDALRGSIRGVTGEADALYVNVERIEVAGLATGPIRVVAHDSQLGQGDGLLGRDFLERFQVSIDNQAGLVTLTPK